MRAELAQLRRHRPSLIGSKGPESGRKPLPQLDHAPGLRQYPNGHCRDHFWLVVCTQVGRSSVGHTARHMSSGQGSFPTPSGSLLITFKTVVHAAERRTRRRETKSANPDVATGMRRHGGGMWGDRRLAAAIGSAAADISPLTLSPGARFDRRVTPH